MMNKISYIIISLAVFLCSCSSDTPMPEQSKGEGRFLLSILTSSVTTEDITRATTFNFDVDTFKVSVFDAKGLELISRHQADQLSDVDRTLPVAEDYRIDVEDCSAHEAVTANKAWGMPRFAASTTFDIIKDETTSLEMVCTMVNAGLKIIFDKSFTQKFTTYAATIQDSRNIVFKAEEKRVAYYNLEQPTGSISVRFTGAAEGWFGDRIDQTRDITLTKGKITNLTVRYNDGTDGEAGISITTDFEMTETSQDVLVQ
ncbi:MAG: DUF4493 domain-containing protein [Bacteroidaceae bacterium]|nr:DUF4493 domain-containing protein [Bacteroidaceae bacterium]